MNAIAPIIRAPDRHLEPQRQGIGDRHTNPVQAAGKAVGAARLLVELATGVKPRENNLDCRDALFGMDAHRNPAAIVIHHDAAIGEQAHANDAGVPGQCFIGRVVDHLLHDMQRIVSAGIHSRALANRLQALENPD